MREWLVLGCVVVGFACSSGSSSDDEQQSGGAAGRAGSSNAGESAGGAGSGGGPAGGAANGGQPAGGEGGATECACLPFTLAWGMVGGHVATVDRSTLAPCAVFTHERGPAGGEATLSCTQGLEQCSGVGSDDIVAALAHDDVQAAIDEAPVLYGSDPRPVDGSVLELVVDGAVIEVGGECSSGACIAVPAGVQALADLLQALEEQELARAVCANVFE